MICRSIFPGLTARLLFAFLTLVPPSWSPICTQYLRLRRGRRRCLSGQLARHVELVALQQREALQVLLPELELQLRAPVGGVGERRLGEVGLVRRCAGGFRRSGV